MFLTACGGGEEPATDGVASAADLDEAVASAEALAEDVIENTDAAGEITAEEAVLGFSQCMRDNGFPDFPDPEIDANGRVNLRGAFQNADIDFQSEEFQTTSTACREEAGAKSPPLME